ncbi:hypothetical protein DFQ27_007293, partial [Actinomortierella ambigua]
MVRTLSWSHSSMFQLSLQGSSRQKALTFEDDLTMPPPAPFLPTPAPRSRSSTPSANGSVASMALQRLRNEFQANFNAFKGDTWALSSGTDVDRTIARQVLTAGSETMMHSFIIENSEEITGLFGEAGDRQELHDRLIR